MSPLGSGRLLFFCSRSVFKKQNQDELIKNRNSIKLIERMELPLQCDLRGRPSGVGRNGFTFEASVKKETKNTWLVLAKVLPMRQTKCIARQTTLKMVQQFPVGEGPKMREFHWELSDINYSQDNCKPIDGLQLLEGSKMPVTWSQYRYNDKWWISSKKNFKIHRPHQTSRQLH